jgi:hypothetical protein
MRASVRAWATTVAFIAVAACSASATARPAASDDDVDEKVVTAIWRVQQLDFNFGDTRGFYTCDALRDKLKAILQTLGAHGSARLELRCNGRDEVDSVRARILVAVPTEATEENIRAATSFGTRERLAARLNGFSLPTAVDIERFPAAWRRVRIKDRHCELLSDVQQQILPQLSARSSKQLDCAPFAMRLKRTLEVEALVRIVPATPSELISAL